MIHVEIVTATGQIIAYGTFPSGVPTDPGHEIAEVADEEAPKLGEPGSKYLEQDGTIRVVPPPPPPLISAEGFAIQEDAARLTLVNERAETDPAFAALADFVLRGVQR